MRLGVVLFNLGGPDSPEAVEPFLRNLFSDPAIVDLPGFLRRPLARWIARRRAPVARAIYDKIGGRSPILAETEAQARALESALAAHGYEARAVIAMRAWKPFAPEAVETLRAWKPERVVLLPLYPQFSTTTTQSSLDDWYLAARTLNLPTARVCCYPWLPALVRAEAKLVRDAFAQRKPGLEYRVLFSAHGLPERIVARGDPYRWQTQRTAAAIAEALELPQRDWTLCYQSRVGPLKWITPATDEEIRRAGREGKALVVAPIAFVSEHSETLVELDIEYRKLAREHGVADYIRVPTLSVQKEFIAGLAELVVRAAAGQSVVTCAEGRICPRGFERCGFGAS